MKPFLCWKKDEEDKKRMQGSIVGLKEIITTNNECMRDNGKQICKSMKDKGERKPSK